MRNYFFITLLILIFACSCSSDDKENSNNVSTNSDTEIIVKESQGEQTIQIDGKFASFLDKFKKSSLPYKKAPKGEEKYDKIPINEQITYLSKAEDLSEKELKEMTDYTDFYYVNNPINTDKYHAIVYGRFEMGSIYYFLCTYNNKGELISHIDFAAYEMMSAGPQAGQEHYTKGEIDNNHKVVVKTEEETSNYIIKDTGEIIEQDTSLN